DAERGHARGQCLKEAAGPARRLEHAVVLVECREVPLDQCLRDPHRGWVLTERTTPRVGARSEDLVRLIVEQRQRLRHCRFLDQTEGNRPWTGSLPPAPRYMTAPSGKFYVTVPAYSAVRPRAVERTRGPATRTGDPSPRAGERRGSP